MYVDGRDGRARTNHIPNVYRRSKTARANQSCHRWKSHTMSTPTECGEVEREREGEGAEGARVSEEMSRRTFAKQWSSKRESVKRARCAHRTHAGVGNKVKAAHQRTCWLLTRGVTSSNSIWRS